MLKRIIISLLFILCLGGVSASHYSGGLFYDDFMAVNQSETIMLYPYDGNLTAYYVGSNMVNMSNNGDYYYVNVVGDEVSDVPFYINIFEGLIQQINGSDNVIDGYELINNSDLYYFKINPGINRSAGSVYSHEICANMRKNPSSSDLSINFFRGVNRSGVYDIVYFDPVVVSSLVFTDYCSNKLISYDYDLNTSDDVIFGLSCNNCDSSNNLRLGLSNNNLVNSSFVNNDTFVVNEVNSSYDWLIYSINFVADDQDEIYFYDGLLKFRIPFNVTFNFYREYEAYDGSLKTEPLGNDFDYLYVIDYVFSDSYVSDNVFQSTSNGLPDFGVDFDKLNFNVNKNNYWFLWSSLSGGSGTITFYEASNYTLYLRQTDVINDGVIDEFKKPVFSDTDFDTKIDVISIDGSVSSFDVVVDELEVRKIEFLRNILFYCGAFLIWFGIMIGLFYVGVDPKIALGVGFSILIFIMGGVSAII